MKIEPLADHPETIPTLAEWYLSEWEPYYGVNGPGDARTDLKARCNQQKLSIGLVAMMGDFVCGTLALDVDATTRIAPSVVGLLVGKEFRRKGIAMKLLQTAEKLARDLGYEKLYLSTANLGDLLERMGWQSIRKAEFLNAKQGSVYVCSLKYTEGILR